MIGGIKFDDRIQEQHTQMKTNFKTYQKHWNWKKYKFTRNLQDYKFEIHLSELEWVVPILQNVLKIFLIVVYQIYRNQ